MARFKLKLEGNKALIKNLDKYTEKTRKVVAEEIEATTYDIQSKAKQRVPVDTGFLKNSINAQAEPGTLRGQVEATVKYAPYVEFGTGGMVSVPQGLEDYAMGFKGKGIKEVNLPPRPFLFPAFFEETPKLIQQIKKELAKWN